MPNNYILQMKHICKSFPGVLALHNINFELRKGEIHVLLGENGAGKSTLMKILSGAYQKTSGEIFIDGENVEIKSPRRAQELGISIIYQEFNLIPQLTLGENIFLGREPKVCSGVINKKKIFKDAKKILSELGLDINPNSVVRKLGVAQQQMVEVAKALSLDARIMIMDEPTSTLTEQEIKELFITIRRLKEKGVSIIYISHRLEELFEIGECVTILRDGENVGTYNINEVTKSQLIRLMVGRELKEQFPKQKAKIGEEVLRTEHLNKGNALKDISFSLHRGEVLGIAGLLGSGRTELARAIFGVDKIDSGRIFLKNQFINIDCPRKAINSRIGFITEDRRSQGLVLILSVKDNVSLPSVERLSSFGILKLKQEDELVKSYVKRLRIKTPSLNQRVMFLSGGNQQKVVLSKWLCSEARILIFDEPTRGIDVGAKVEIYQLMNKLTAEGVAVIMISSELPEILGMSDRILVMHQGRIAKEFSVEEATEEKILHYALGQE